MHCGYNTQSINSAPFNGRGVYRVHKVCAVAWMLCLSAPLIVLDVAWSVRALALRWLSAAWLKRGLVHAHGDFGWSIRARITRILYSDWHLTGGFLRVLCARWRVALRAHRVNAVFKKSQTKSQTSCPFQNTK